MPTGPKRERRPADMSATPFRRRHYAMATRDQRVGLSSKSLLTGPFLASPARCDAVERREVAHAQPRSTAAIRALRTLRR